jgi:diacylglycerol kinase
MERIKRRIHHIGFHHAWDGLKHAFINHPNFKVHSTISLLVLILAFIFKISEIKLIILVFAIVLGFVVEMVNTSIESIVDLVTEEWRQNAKIAKDVSAGAMLLTAIGTAIVGLIILVPEILKTINH